MTTTTADQTIAALALVERFTATGLDHPIRARIVSMLLTNEEPLSPTMVQVRMSESYANVTLGSIAYHFRWLRDKNLIREAKTVQRRGATEHFYRPKADLERLLEKALPERNGKRRGRKPSLPTKRPGRKAAAAAAE